MINGAKNRRIVRIIHFNTNAIAEFHERRRRLAIIDRFDGADFRDTRIAETTLIDGLARLSALQIGYRAGTDYCTRAERSGFRRVRYQLSEIECHVDACFRFAEGFCIEE